MNKNNKKKTAVYAAYSEFSDEWKSNPASSLEEVKRQIDCCDLDDAEIEGLVIYKIVETNARFIKSWSIKG